MNICKRIIRRIGPLLFVAVIVVSVMAIRGVLAIISDHTVPLINTFCPDESVHAHGDLDIQVHKTMRNLGQKAILPQGFQFELKDVNTEKAYTATTAANGKAVFHLSFDVDDVGTHRYCLTEIKGDLPGVTYSEQVYEVRVEVIPDNPLKIDVYLNGEKTDTVQAAFENLYDSSAIPPHTGDTTPLLWYAATLLISAAGIVLLIRKAVCHAA